MSLTVQIELIWILFSTFLQNVVMQYPLQPQGAVLDSVVKQDLYCLVINEVLI